MPSEDVERLLKDFLDESAAERRKGITLSALHGTMMRMSDRLEEHVKTDDKRFDDHDGRIRRLRDRLRDMVRGRAPMPSSADDSGSIDIGGPGFHAKFVGPPAIKVGLILAAFLAIFLGGYAVHAALASRPQPGIVAK